MKYKLLILIVCFMLNHKSFPQSKVNIWETFFEKSGYLSTPDYEETIKYFEEIANNSSYARMFAFGKSPQGRELYCFIVSKEKLFNVDDVKKSKKPILMIMNGIHAGEIEGKDACMLLLRDILITKEKSQLLDNCILMIIPVFNVDGHERKSPYNRINQNGPTEMGWRTTSQNLNLNRDFMKADAPEMKAFLQLYNKWLPDIFIDTHTTDGADYQYSITYAIENHQNVLPETAEWIKQTYIPFIEKDVEDQGFWIMPYIDFKDRDIKNGLLDWVTTPRFSHGYTVMHNRPGLLIETHMLKPYKERVFATKALITSTIKIMNEKHDEIIKMNNDADKEIIDKYIYKKEKFPLEFKFSDEYSVRHYKGIEAVNEDSWITGNKVTRYTGKKFEMDIPYFNNAVVTGSVSVPESYIVPMEYGNLVDILTLHGVKTKNVKNASRAIVEKYKFKNVKFPQRSFEGRFIPQFEYDTVVDTVVLNKGDYMIPTEQKTLPVIEYLLEPLSEDSFVKWGFMKGIFEQKEYFEEYSMEPIAEKMAEENPKLKEEFMKKLESDDKFKASSRQRLSFFYERSPYFDKQLNVYPVLRVIKILD